MIKILLTRLLISEKCATYMIKWSYTIIWQVRVSTLNLQIFGLWENAKYILTIRLKLLTYQIEKPLECHPLKSPPLYCQTEVREKTLHSSSRPAQAGIANIYFSPKKLSGF